MQTNVESTREGTSEERAEDSTVAQRTHLSAGPGHFRPRHFRALMYSLAARTSIRVRYLPNFNYYVDESLKFRTNMSEPSNGI